jgi:hypothetical protein
MVSRNLSSSNSVGNSQTLGGGSNTALLLHAETAAQNYIHAKIILLQAIQAIERNSAFLVWGFTSLYDFATQKLGLTEDVAYMMIAVGRKALEIPALQHALEKEGLHLSKAKRIVPLLTEENASHWIARAKSLSKSELEKEIAQASPAHAVNERASWVAPDRLHLQCGVSELMMEKIRRVQDLESQRTSSVCTIEQALQAAVESYLEKHDPLRKAERFERRERVRKVGPGRKLRKQQARLGRLPLNARLRHSLVRRDEGRCVELLPSGARCTNRRWLEVHHTQSIADGGTNTLSNLKTLCYAHHRMKHSPSFQDHSANGGLQ